MRKHLALLRKDASMSAPLLGVSLLCSLLVVLSRDGLAGAWFRSGRWDQDGGPFWFLSIFSELFLIGVLIPAVGLSDSMSRPTSFHWGRPVSVRNILWLKVLLLSGFGAFVPAMFEFAFWLAHGFRIQSAVDCAFELFAVRLFLIAPLIALGTFSSSYREYGKGVVARFIFTSVSLLCCLSFLVFVAVSMQVVGGVSLLKTTSRFREVAEPIVWASLCCMFWLGTVRAAPVALSRRGALVIGAFCALPLSGLYFLSLQTEWSGKENDGREVVKHLPQELFLLRREEGDVIGAKHQRGEDGMLTRIEFHAKHRVFVTRAASNDLCLSLDSLVKVLEWEGVLVRAVGWMPNCYTFGEKQTQAKIHYSRLSLDYRLPFSEGAELLSESRKIELVKVSEGRYVFAQIIEYEYSLLREGRPVGSVETWMSEDDSVPRLYFLVNARSGEVLPIQARHNPLESDTSALLTPRHSRNRRVSLSFFTPQYQAPPSDDWTREAELFVFRGDPIHVLPLESSAQSTSWIETPSDAEEEYVRLPGSEAAEER